MNKIKKISKLKKFIFCVLLIFGVAMCSALFTSFATSPQNASIDGIDYTFLVNQDNTATIIKVDPHDKTECNIPSVINTYPVKFIGTQTENMQDIFQIDLFEGSDIPFYQFNNLESVTIPEGVESIGSLTFMDCPNLTSVIMPTTVTSIYFYAFYNCSSIQSLTIPPNVTSIGANAFVCDENNHLGSFFISENTQVQTLSDPDNGDSITTIVPNSTIVYKYNVLDQSNVSEGKIPVEIVSARAESNHNESSEDDIDIPNTIDCGAMGENYAIHSVSSTEMQLIHNLTHFDAVDPTCSSSGNSEYWFCDRCEKYFSDEQGETEIDADSLILGATVHNMTAHEAVLATCTTNGNRAYWSCDRCNKYFSDKNGETEIESDSWISQAKGHNWNDPTYSWTQENGIWTCTATRVCQNNVSHSEELGTITVSGYSGEYDGLAQGLTVTGEITGSSILYSADEGEDKTWGADAPKYTEIGNYTVYVKIQNNESHIDSDIKSATIKISEHILLGDINADKSINILDLKKLCEHVAGFPILTDEQKAGADINQDGNINIFDLQALYIICAAA